jgi:hypothetical protein
MRRCLMVLLGCTAALVFSGTPVSSVASGQTITPLPGYWLVGADGGVFAFGAAPYLGSGVGNPNAAVVGSPYIGMTPGLNGGYCLGTAQQGADEFGGANCGQAKCDGVCASLGTAIRPAPGTGDASFSLRNGSLTVPNAGDGDAYGISAAPVVGFAYTPDGKGYWEVAADGGVFAYGDAAYYGSLGGLSLDAPIVGMAATADGKGYWLVAADGGIFAFGDAPFDGSMGGQPLNAPVVGIAANPYGPGYWLAAADGGIFAFGKAPFDGSMGGQPLNAPVVGIAADSSPSPDPAQSQVPS